jgi:hypothetical protein
MDEFLKFVSNMEQASAVLAEFSRLIASYHTTLISAGVEPKEAVVLSKSFQSELVKKIFDFIVPNKSIDQE